MRTITAIGLLLVVNNCLAEIPDNAACVIDEYREYSKLSTSLYNSVLEEIKREDEISHVIASAYAQMSIADLELRLWRVEKWWKKKPEMLFRYSKKLAKIGSGRASNAATEESQFISGPKLKWDAVKMTYSVKERGVAIDLFFEKMRSNSMSEKVHQYVKLKWADIQCDA